MIPANFGSFDNSKCPMITSVDPVMSYEYDKRLKQENEKTVASDVAVGVRILDVRAYCFNLFHSLNIDTNKIDIDDALHYAFSNELSNAFLKILTMSNTRQPHFKVIEDLNYISKLITHYIKEQVKLICNINLKISLNVFFGTIKTDIYFSQGANTKPLYLIKMSVSEQNKLEVTILINKNFHKKYFSLSYITALVNTVCAVIEDENLIKAMQKNYPPIHELTYCLCDREGEIRTLQSHIIKALLQLMPPAYLYHTTSNFIDGNNILKRTHWSVDVFQEALCRMAVKTSVGSNNTCDTWVDYQTREWRLLY